MKLINLIPQAIKDERRNKKIQRSMLVLSMVPIGMYGYGQYDISQIKKETMNFQAGIASAQNLENEIRLLEGELFSNTRVVSGLSDERFPLHRFLLFMSISLPKDTRLYSVTTDNVEKIKIKEEEDEKNPQQIPTADEETEEASNDIGGTPAPPVANTVEPVKTPEQIVVEERIKQEEEQKKIQELLTSQKTLFIRGATLSINSLGIFMKELEDNEYITKVDIQDIQNYYNGAYSYKFFELTVTLK